MFRVGSELLQEIRNLVPFLASVAILLAIFELVSGRYGIPSFIVPKPSSILNYMLHSGVDWTLHVESTMVEVLTGFFAGVVTGIAIALGLTYSKAFSRIVFPYLVIWNILPKVALAPLFIIVMGAGLLPRFVIVYLTAIFPLVVPVATGLSQIPTEMVDLARILRASEWKMFVKIRFPNALPYMFAGLKVSITVSFIMAIVAEFVGSSSGLGYLILVAEGTLNTDLMFASIGILALVALIAYALVAWIERWAMPWKPAGEYQ